MLSVVIWTFLAAPWLAWVAFHPVADARLGWALISRPCQGSVAVMEALSNAYNVPPFSYVFNALRQTRAVRSPTCFSYVAKRRIRDGIIKMAQIMLERPEKTSCQRARD
jgi:hypothetical protein